MILKNKILKITIFIVFTINIFGCNNKEKIENNITKGKELLESGKYTDAYNKFTLANNLANKSDKFSSYRNEISYLISKSELKQAKEYFDKEDLLSFKLFFNSSIDNLLLSLKDSSDYNSFKTILVDYKNIVNYYTENKEEYTSLIDQKKSLENKLNTPNTNPDFKKKVFTIIRRFNTNPDGKGMYEAIRSDAFGKVVLIMNDREDRGNFVSLYVKYMGEFEYVLRETGNSEFFKTYMEIEKSEDPESNKERLDEINSKISLLNLENSKGNISLIFSYLFAAQENKNLDSFKNNYLKSLESNNNSYYYNTTEKNNINQAEIKNEPIETPIQSIEKSNKQEHIITETPDGNFEEEISNNFDNKIYKGSINGKYKFHMELTKSGDLLTGNYYYDSVMKKISLSGKINSSGGFYIEEYSNNELTGIFEGSFHNSYSKISGVWKNPKNNKKMIFEAE